MSYKVLDYQVFRRIRTIAAATLVLGLSACLKPGHVDLEQKGIVGGRIINVNDRTPIAAAALSVDDRQAALSDPQGAFAVNCLPGTHRIAVHAAGYRDVALTITVVKGSMILATSDGYIRLAPIDPR